MNKEIKNANRCLEKLKERFLSAYYAGFNQAHYSHMHPDTFEVKECQSAGEEYMVKNEKYLISDLKEYASQFKQPDISEDVLQELGEKEVMIIAFDKVRKMFDLRSWIMQGRGPYPYDDDRYKEEVRYLFDEFDALQKDVWKNIKTKTFEYRNKIIESYKAEQPVPTVDEDELIEAIKLIKEAIPNSNGEWGKRATDFISKHQTNNL